MTNFLFKDEKKISKEFENKGFVIKKIKDFKSLSKIRNLYIKSLKKNLKFKTINRNENYILNNIHKKIKVNRLNSFRLKLLMILISLKKLESYIIKFLDRYWT